MYSLSEQQIDFILGDISARGVRLESLQHDLLDHICVIIEQKLEKAEGFEQCYESTIQSFYRQELREIEDETIFLLACRNRLTLSRSQFFLLLFTIFIGPFVSYDLAWLLRSGPTAGWNIPLHIWAPTMVYSLFPLLILLVLLLTPERLDPLIPAKSKVLLGIRPFIKIIKV
ncbi:MAG TPA: hypothetical protein VG052_08310 [Puia sp.]|jgi:hypothetical protein|nr:hypothetical protein [Puia sp.]